MDKGIPDRVFYELANYNRYRVSPKRVPVIGFEEVIQKLKRDDVYSYYTVGVPAEQPGLRRLREP